MKNALGFSTERIQSVFSEWNQGELNSYLIEITANILGTIDPHTGEPLLELIGDRAGQKGTGKWTSQEALELGVAAPTIAEGVFARILSGAREQRDLAARLFPAAGGELVVDASEFVEAIRQALFASKICAYAQGFELLQHASDHYEWNLNLSEISKSWRAGCIIRAQFLERISGAYEENPSLINLLFDPYFQEAIESSSTNWRWVVSTATEQGLPVPGFSSALAYFDGIRHPFLWTNLVQAQRDYFGAHTYERRDRPGVFHTDWQEQSLKK